MIVRPFTFLAGLLFALSGAYLFVVKHQSQSLEGQLEQSAEHARQDEEAIRVLKAQWALEADPSRIASLAARFTGLQPMKPGQLVTVASLADSLPAPGQPAPFSNPQDEIPALSGAGDAASAPAAPPIEVRGHVAAAQTGAPGSLASIVAPRPTTYPEQLADNAMPAGYSSLPKPPPVRPYVIVQHVAVHWTAEAKEHEKPLRWLPLAQSHSEVYEASAIAPVSRPERRLPIGAQVVRIRATGQPTPMAEPAPMTQPDLPMGGGSLLGMAQAGSQN